MFFFFQIQNIVTLTLILDPFYSCAGFSSIIFKKEKKDVWTVSFLINTNMRSLVASYDIIRQANFFLFFFNLFFIENSIFVKVQLQNVNKHLVLQNGIISQKTSDGIHIAITCFFQNNWIIISWCVNIISTSHHISLLWKSSLFSIYSKPYTTHVFKDTLCNFSSAFVW